MLRPSLWLAGLLATSVFAADSDTDTGTVGSYTQSIVTVTGSHSVSTFTGTYLTYNGQSTVTATTTIIGVSSTSSSGSGTGSSTTSSSKGTTSVGTLLVGGVGAETISVINGTTTIFPNATSTTASSTSASATNTQACNNYVDFCERQYGNITEVCAHNSAFVKSGNAASNQQLGITDQLDDGIRMIQGEVHYVNKTLYSCHTTCSLLNAGTWLSELETVADWVKKHPFDVVTILIVNSDYAGVGNFSTVLESSGLGPYLYTPPYVPMRLSQWPTLSEMILTQKRVVVFMDYQANQTAYPYILDEFTHMWETPFSPENTSFPCTVQRPPTLTNDTEARDDFLYLANHNLNQDITIAGTSFLIPNTAEIGTTNAAGTQTGMLGAMAQTCDGDWQRPPNFLLVDYYNIGNGSVFEVAAKYNNVTYTRKCCGNNESAASGLGRPSWSILAATAALCFALLMV